MDKRNSKTKINLIVCGELCEKIEDVIELQKRGICDADMVERARARFNRELTELEKAWEIEEITESLW